MRSRKREAGAPPDKMDIMIFRLTGALFGVDMAQVAGLEKPDPEAAAEMNVPWFHEFFPRWRTEATYESVHLLFLADGADHRRTLIDQPVDVNVSVPVDQIRPLPPLIECAVKGSPLWAAALKENKVILLADLSRASAWKEGGAVMENDYCTRIRP